MNNKNNQALMAARNIVVEFEKKGSVDKFRALDNVNLIVNAGETVGLVGESGSGKTTLGRSVLRIQPIDSGSITLNGVDITKYSERALRPLRSKMQMIFQDPGGSFNPRQSLEESLRIALKVHKICAPAEIDKRIDQLLERVGLSAAFRHRLPHEVSGGQLQRVAIARALALEPLLIVADEAVSKLDVSVRSGVLNLLRDIQEQDGLSMIFITHDLAVAKYLSHKLVVLYHGHVLEEGSAAELFNNPLHPYTRMLLSKDNAADGINENFTLASKELANQGCRYVNSCPHAMDKCSSTKPVLEEQGNDHRVACWLVAKP